MSLTINRYVRDALRSAALGYAESDSSRGSVLRYGDRKAALRYREHVEDAARLLDDLGPEEDPHDSYALTMPPERLERVLRRYLTEAGARVETVTHILERGGQLPWDTDEEHEARRARGMAHVDAQRRLALVCAVLLERLGAEQRLAPSDPQSGMPFSNA